MQAECLPFFVPLYPEIGWNNAYHHLTPEACPFPCSMQLTQLSINWNINLEGSAWLFASKV
jgi:hypothetical protein